MEGSGREGEVSSPRCLISLPRTFPCVGIVRGLFPGLCCCPSSPASPFPPLPWAAGGVQFEARNASGVNGAALDMVNVAERELFQSGEKLVAVISEAASAGISLHADRRMKNKVIILRDGLASTLSPSSQSLSLHTVSLGSFLLIAARHPSDCSLLQQSP